MKIWVQLKLIWSKSEPDIYRVNQEKEEHNSNFNNNNNNNNIIIVINILPSV
jgi:hypothetical protein